ncbi:GNAT family N-acetyltransferase [Streptomyces ipomoeae]|uniref:Acetyltransferase, GNAT family n=2 Tax=Streptomyces ipomoeae TaxID=103232 RepID=L1L8B3_9ACTN|nr:GNAT family N-acetyltransferase [Streptomyces ipomoeae]EKX69167.1 acetyltransferase, GNAT family [Streptomyces ipomoeae 91-03]MDX2699627.1 GNAT family N-acetyltransferase [Streptomyces ipomoeae]MDX2827187.1 GNAT family N-acetyltransferase [Streptomyces ipomoeae]MDX2845291.1 GNAT family N-acetyltransferase [Streptomyces ipomoeae]MDX2877369.1 GNAT family N-acetyltransferase [Streptomyces ipomoeae]
MTALRLAGPADAVGVARLHADSWRRHYRGAYADAFLDGDVVADREAVWAARFAEPDAGVTILAEDVAGELLGFVHVVLDEDAAWGSLVDNLHVSHHRRRTGVGGRLLTRAAEEVAGRAVDGTSLYLWVLEQNTAARKFYESYGGRCVEKTMVSPPGGHPERLNGTPAKLRVAWHTASSVSHAPK